MVTSTTRSPGRVLQTRSTENVRYCNGQSDGGTTVTPFNGGAVYYAYQKARTWVRTPGYHTLVKTGPLPDNDYSCEEIRLDLDGRVSWSQQSSSSCSNNLPNNWNETYRLDEKSAPLVLLGAADAPVTLTLFDVSHRILTRANDNQFNVPVFLAEARSTASMVLGAAQSLVGLSRALRRGDVGYFMDHLHVSHRVSSARRRRLEREFNSNFGRDASLAAGNLWLQMRYGWIPFMSDARNAVNTLMDVIDVPSRRIGRVTASSSRTYSTSEDKLLGVSGPTFFGNHRQVVRESRRMVWRFEPNSADLPARFGLINPLEVAWELIPFSFVADWFLPIGSYLSSLSAGMRYSHVGGTSGYKREVSNFYSRFSSPVHTSISGEYQSSRVNVSRSKLTSIPKPELSDMRFSVDLSATQITSGLALLRQSLGGFSR